MGKLRIAVAGCSYKEIDRQLQEQQIHGLNDSEMVTQIVCSLTVIKDTCFVTSEQVLGRIGQVEAQRSQTVILCSLRETRDFEVIGSG